MDRRGYKYRLYDSDFIPIDIEIDKWVGNSVLYSQTLAVVEFYENRSLPVVSALLKCLLYISRYYGSMDRLLAWNREYNPYWGKYGKDVEKLLLLL